MYRFESLDIWHEAINFCTDLLEFAEELPKNLQYNIASQLRSASLSVPNNIAEGSGSDSRQEFRNFLNYSCRSMYEVVSILAVCKKRNLMAESRFKRLYERSEILTKRIRAFRAKL
ncbi:MAG: four helix bundle protein [Candidatus Omnitrophota bacterium]